MNPIDAHNFLNELAHHQQTEGRYESELSQEQEKDVKIATHILAQENPKGLKKLRTLAAECSRPLLKILISEGSKKGNSAILHPLCASKDEEGLKMVLSHLKFNEISLNWAGALCRMIGWQAGENLLLDAGASPEKILGGEIFQMIRENQPESLDSILTMGAFCQGNFANMAICDATRAQNPKLLEILLKHKVSVEEAAKNHIVDLAANYGSREHLSALIRADYPVTLYMCAKGYLQRAAREGDYNMFLFNLELIEGQMTSQEVLNACESAIRSGAVEILDYLDGPHQNLDRLLTKNEVIKLARNCAEYDQLPAIQLLIEQKRPWLLETPTAGGLLHSAIRAKAEGCTWYLLNWGTFNTEELQGALIYAKAEMQDQEELISTLEKLYQSREIEEKDEKS